MVTEQESYRMFTNKHNICILPSSTRVCYKLREKQSQKEVDFLERSDVLQYKGEMV